MNRTMYPVLTPPDGLGAQLRALGAYDPRLSALSTTGVIEAGTLHGPAGCAARGPTGPPGPVRLAGSVHRFCPSCSSDDDLALSDGARLLTSVHRWVHWAGQRVSDPVAVWTRWRSMSEQRLQIDGWVRIPDVLRTAAERLLQDSLAVEQQLRERLDTAEHRRALYRRCLSVHRRLIGPAPAGSAVLATWIPSASEAVTCRVDPVLLDAVIDTLRAVTHRGGWCAGTVPAGVAALFSITGYAHAQTAVLGCEPDDNLLDTVWSLWQPVGEEPLSQLQAAASTARAVLAGPYRLVSHE